MKISYPIGVIFAIVVVVCPLFGQQQPAVHNPSFAPMTAIVAPSKPHGTAAFVWTSQPSFSRPAMSVEMSSERFRVPYFAPARVRAKGSVIRGMFFGPEHLYALRILPPVF